MKTPEELAEELDRQAVLYVSLKARNDVSYYVGMDCYKAGYQAAAPQWISVKDRLPELVSRCENRSYGDDVLWLTKTGEMVVGNCRKVNEHISVLIPVGEPLITNFTHWMPLPAAPKEEA